MTNENRLLERARSYDQDALGEIYDEYAPLIYNYLYRRVGDAQLAEDLTSEVFMRVLQAIQGGKTWRTSFRGWLYRIAHNLVVDHFRAQPPAPLPLDERLIAAENQPDDKVEERFFHKRLRAAIARLTPGQQEVLALRFGEQLTAREVAEVMEKSTNAVEVQQHRALASLRRILELEIDE